MRKNMRKQICCFILIIIVLFAAPVSSAFADQSFSLLPVIEASALLSADDDGLTREKVQLEMYERYKGIFDFVNQADISVSAQAAPFESGDQSSDSDIDALALELTADCTDDYDKARTLYQWIIENIYYDYDYYNGKKNTVYSSATDVFEYKYTVCEGYANLYTAMCRSVGVPCRKVIGFSSSDTVSDEVYFADYFKNESDHAWNEVYVNETWIVVDATWDCANTYIDGVFTQNSRTVKWFGADFQTFSSRHMGMSYGNSFESDEYTFSVYDNKITAGNYIGTSTEIVIPQGVNIISYISKTKTDFTSVTLPSTLISISDAAFKNCTALTSIVIPESVTEIGYEAFSGCSALSEIELPESVNTLGSKAFYKCSGIKSINIPDGIGVIPVSAFYNCTSLAEISIPASVTEIEATAFKSCTSLKSVYLPESITSLGSGIFQGCTGLENAAFVCNTAILPSNCFSKCTSLTAIDISEAVTEIGNNAFRGCSALKTVSGAENVKILRYQAFMGCTVLEDCSFCNSLTRLEYNAFRECEKITGVTIPYTYANIDEYSFYNCKSLEIVVIEGNVTTIDEAAFYQCESLKEINIPSTVTSIGEFAFAGCVSLESIDLPDGLTALSASVFSGCAGLKSIGGDIPACVESIGEYAFYNCVLEGKYTLPDGVTDIPKCAFYQCNGITEITIPVSVTTIGEFAFTRAESLTDVYYLGKQSEWDLITVGENNTALLNAELHCLGDHTHSYISEVTTQLTCTVDGVITYTCSCGDTYTETIAKSGHMEGILPAVSATCLSTGLTEGKNCTVCGEVLVAQTVTDKLYHTESGWITDESASCSKEGSKHTECTVCHTVINTGIISKTVHTEITVPAVSATCLSTGLTEGKNCTVCGEVLVAQTVTDKLDHTESGWIADESASCSKEGSKHTECTVCHTVINTDIISKTAHTEAAVPAVSATCTSMGLTEGKKCSACDETLVAQTVTDILDHTQSSWITDESSSCSKEGSKHTECTVCHTVINTDIISKTAHTEITVPAVSATCTSTGLTEGKKCSVCDETLVAQTVTDILDHTQSSWITDESASCSKEGSKHTECTVCHTVINTDIISKTAHTEITVPAVSATCTSTGLTKGKKCTACGEILVAQKTVAKLSHTDSDRNGKCDTCSISTNPADNCSHMCHKSGFSAFIWAIVKFFIKLFATNKICECGTAHY